MSTENAERMQRTDDAWNGRDWDAFDTLHDPECVVYWPGREADPTRGGADHRAEAIAFCEAFPDNAVKNRPYDVLFGEGDFTCFVTRFTGTFTAPLKQSGGTAIEPTGKSFDVLYSTAAKWRDGRIIEEISSTTTPRSSSRSASPDGTVRLRRQRAWFANVAC